MRRHECFVEAQSDIRIHRMPDSFYYTIIIRLNFKLINRVISALKRSRHFLKCDIRLRINKASILYNYCMLYYIVGLFIIYYASCIVFMHCVYYVLSRVAYIKTLGIRPMYQVHVLFIMYCVLCICISYNLYHVLPVIYAVGQYVIYHNYMLSCLYAGFYAYIISPA